VNARLPPSPGIFPLDTPNRRRNNSIMLFPADYHMHTPLCHHALGEPVDYAAHALSIGLDEIAFTEHSPMEKHDWDDWRMHYDAVGSYIEKVNLARKRHPGLRILIGLEVDYLPGHEPWIRHLRELHSWDFFIGSVHYISDSFDIDNPKKLSEWKTRDPFEVWSLYFDRLKQAAESRLFQTIGHADLPKKFKIYPREDCTLLFERFLDAARASGTAIELNTAGLRKDCKEIYPSRKILDLARERDVKITFGSDAHAPQEVGADFALAVALARLTGYTECVRFDQGEARNVPIP
jgi:histidinol-phosphatase (PHP family)